MINGNTPPSFSHVSRACRIRQSAAPRYYSTTCSRSLRNCGAPNGTWTYESEAWAGRAAAVHVRTPRPTSPRVGGLAHAQQPHRVSSRRAFPSPRVLSPECSRRVTSYGGMWRTLLTLKMIRRVMLATRLALCATKSISQLSSTVPKPVSPCESKGRCANETLAMAGRLLQPSEHPRWRGRFGAT